MKIPTYTTYCTLQIFLEKFSGNLGSLPYCWIDLSYEFNNYVQQYMHFLVSRLFLSQIYESLPVIIMMLCIMNVYQVGLHWLRILAWVAQ